MYREFKNESKTKLTHGFKDTNPAFRVLQRVILQSQGSILPTPPKLNN